MCEKIAKFDTILWNKKFDIIDKKSTGNGIKVMLDIIIFHRTSTINSPKKDKKNANFQKTSWNKKFDEIDEKINNNNN